jgi:hypothetical protein
MVEPQPVVESVFRFRAVVERETFVETSPIGRSFSIARMRRRQKLIVCS